MREGSENRCEKPAKTGARIILNETAQESARESAHDPARESARMQRKPVRETSENRCEKTSVKACEKTNVEAAVTFFCISCDKLFLKLIKWG